MIFLSEVLIRMLKFEKADIEVKYFNADIITISSGGNETEKKCVNVKRKSA